jgi:lysozyme family protein
MPLKKDPKGGGGNADGSRSTKYCSLCYDKGAFRHPNFTAQEMQEFCVHALRKKGMPRIVAWLLTRGIPRLERWRAAGARR